MVVEVDVVPKERLVVEREDVGEVGYCDPDDDEDDEVDVCRGNVDLSVLLVVVVLLVLVNLRMCSLLYTSIACKSSLYLSDAAVIKRIRLASICCCC